MKTEKVKKGFEWNKTFLAKEIMKATDMELRFKDDYILIWSIKKVKDNGK